MLSEATTFRNCDFDGADFEGIEADFLSIEDCTLRRANLTNLLCHDLRLKDSILENAALNNVEAHEAQITGCSFTSREDAEGEPEPIAANRLRLLRRGHGRLEPVWREPHRLPSSGALTFPRSGSKA